MTPALGRAGLALAFCWLLLLPAPAAAQLRPYDPVDWAAFDGPKWRLEVGALRLDGQRASLAGEQGSLLEVAAFAGAVRVGSVVIAVDGVPYRRFERRTRFTDLHGGAQPDLDGVRSDVGDFQIATLIPLTTAASPLPVILRFGTRLPTTDNRIGLERDQIDFMATLGSRATVGGADLTAELGVGIHGTRDPGFEQSDVFVFNAGIEARRLIGTPRLSIVGHADGLPDRAIRGNEELAEVRLRARTPGTRWISAELIRGVVAFSPDWGATVAVGMTW